MRCPCPAPSPRTDQSRVEVCPATRRRCTSASRLRNSTSWSRTAECQRQCRSTRARFGISAPLTWPLTRFRRRLPPLGTACEPMTRIKLRHVNQYRDRHGKVRRYFRRKGQRALPLPGLPGSIAFMAAYEAAHPLASPPPPSPKHVTAGSLAVVAAGYFRSADFANLSPSSQRSYRVALKPILAAHGHRLVRELPKEAARHIIEGIGAARPGPARERVGLCPLVYTGQRGGGVVGSVGAH